MRIAFTHNLQTSHDEAQAEFDREETVAAIADAIAQLGHEVVRINVGGAVTDLCSSLEKLQPDLVFNTAEGEHGRFREAFYPALFEQLGLRFTGSDAWVCALTLDKQLTKLTVQGAGIPTPRWVFVDEATVDAVFEKGVDLRFPVIAKPNFEGSSKGITQDSIVEQPADLEARVRGILAKYPSGLLIEEFIVGRDVVVPYLETLGVLAPVSYRFDEAVIGKRKYTIYDYDLKCVHSDAVVVDCPAPIDDAIAQRLHALSRRVFDVLNIRDMGRIDWRIAEDGSVYFLEVNALPSLEPGAGIYLAAAHAGKSEVVDVMRAIIDSALMRQRRVPAAAVEAPFRIGFAHNVKRKKPHHSEDDDSEAEYDAPETLAAIAQSIGRQRPAWLNASRPIEVIPLEANASFASQLERARVDMVFNLSEGQHGRGRECHVPAVLEMSGIVFTGSDAVTMGLCLDKALAKKVVLASGVATAQFCVVDSETELDAATSSLAFPLLLKPIAEGSSKGVKQRSVVETREQLHAAFVSMHRQYRQPVLVEEFLSGREFTVGVVGQQNTPRVLSPMEIVFCDPDNKHPIYAFGDKLDWSKGIRYDRPAHVDEVLAREISAVALGVWRALGCRDVCRIDMRQNGEGRLCFIEANPLPGLTPGWSDLCLIADGDGIAYDDLLSAIMAPAFERYRARKELP